MRNKKIRFHIGPDGMIWVYPTNKIITTALIGLKSAEYDDKSKMWRIPAEDYPSAYERLRAAIRGSVLENRNLNGGTAENSKENSIQPALDVIDRIPMGVVKLARKKMSEAEFAPYGKIYNYLLPFQMEGVIFGLKKGGRVMIADDMGLGKTIQALAIAEYYKIEWPALVIAPASLLENWAESVQKFLGVDANIIRKRADVGGGTIDIASYEMATKCNSEIRDQNYFVFIVDECHYLKNMNSKRCGVLVPIIRKSNRIILLSGTPALSRPLELYPIFQIFDEKMFASFFEYGKRYCNARKIRQWYDYKGASNTEELNFILTKMFMIRRTKNDVLKELPRKFRRHIILSPREKQNIDIKDLSDISRLYKEAAEKKIDAVLEYLAGIIDKDIKFLVFAHHTQMLGAIEAFVADRNIPYIKIDGNVPVSARHRLVTAFQEDSDIRIAILSLTAASTGLTLTEGKIVIFAELYWNPGTLLQAEDRIHRIGQVDCVDIHYLTAKNTFDEYVWPKMVEKLNVLEKLGIGRQELKNVESLSISQELLEKFMKSKD